MGPDSRKTPIWEKRKKKERKERQVFGRPFLRLVFLFLHLLQLALLLPFSCSAGLARKAQRLSSLLTQGGSSTSLQCLTGRAPQRCTCERTVGRSIDRWSNVRVSFSSFGERRPVGRLTVAYLVARGAYGVSVFLVGTNRSPFW